MALLSAHDKAILNCVFNPNLPLTEAYSEDLDETIIDTEDDNPEIIKTKAMGKEAIKKAEMGMLNEALNILNNAIQIAPNRPALYNDRAQVFQFNGSLKEAFNDLTTAIDLCDTRHPRTLCQALCQRGMLHRKSAENVRAKQDFEKAAQLGSQFAKSQLVELNPYAALCNQMLRKVMEDLK